MARAETLTMLRCEELEESDATLTAREHETSQSPDGCWVHRDTPSILPPSPSPRVEATAEYSDRPSDGLTLPNTSYFYQ